MAQRIGIRATIMPLTEAESLTYIRQRVAKVALPGGRSSPRVPSRPWYATPEGCRAT